MDERLRPGKVPFELIEGAISGSLPEGVSLGPALGEDAALVMLGGETWALACDPITFTTADAGRLAVLVNANDVAVRGAEPRFFVAALLVAPHEAEPERIQATLRRMRETCEQVGAALVGGHTEVTPGLPHSLVVGTMLGRVTGRALTTGGLRAGDRVGMTRFAGLEGTGILLAEHHRALTGAIGADLVRDTESALARAGISVVDAARLAAACEGTSALHDVTEGGVAEALFEMASASGLAIRLELDAVPLLDGTRAICEELSLDPLGLIGSGAMLVGCAPESADGLREDFARVGIPFAWIGEALLHEDEEGPRVLVDRGMGARTVALPRFPRDEVLKAGVLEGLDGYVFDMDGTLVDSHYDWPAIRAALGVEGASIIDELNGRDAPAREEGWARMLAFEAEATEGADVMPGAPQILDLIHDRGHRTALVTNNTDENTHKLMARFKLHLDEVLTRDSGLWKPAGDPVTEAIRRLGMKAERCVMIGDSRYDLAAGRAAGCRAVVLVGDLPEDVRDAADLHFETLADFLRYLRIVG